MRDLLLFLFGPSLWWQGRRLASAAGYVFLAMPAIVLKVAEVLLAQWHLAKHPSPQPEIASTPISGRFPTAKDTLHQYALSNSILAQKAFLFLFGPSLWWQGRRLASAAGLGWVLNQVFELIIVIWNVCAKTSKNQFLLFRQVFRQFLAEDKTITAQLLNVPFLPRCQHLYALSNSILAQNAFSQRPSSFLVKGSFWPILSSFRLAI
jgi:hypothetical protein